MVQAITTKAKLHGLLIDRKESGAPGDFAGLQSADEVLAAIAAQFGPDVASLLSARQEGALVEAAPEATSAIDLGATAAEGNA